MTKAYTVEQVRSRLNEWVARDGYKAVGEACGTTEQYIRAILAPDGSPQKRPPSQKVIAALGLTAAYVRIK